MMKLATAVEKRGQSVRIYTQGEAKVGDLFYLERIALHRVEQLAPPDPKVRPFRFSLEEED